MANLAEVVASALPVEELREDQAADSKAAGRFPSEVLQEAVAAPGASKETEARDDGQKKEKEREAAATRREGGPQEQVGMEKRTAAHCP